MNRKTNDLVRKIDEGRELHNDEVDNLIEYCEEFCSSQLKRGFITPFLRGW